MSEMPSFTCRVFHHFSKGAAQLCQVKPPDGTVGVIVGVGKTIANQHVQASKYQVCFDLDFCLDLGCKPS